MPMERNKIATVAPELMTGCAICESRMAPLPKPATPMPVARPLRAEYHLTMFESTTT